MAGPRHTCHDDWMANWLDSRTQMERHQLGRRNGRKSGRVQQRRKGRQNPTASGCYRSPANSRRRFLPIRVSVEPKQSVDLVSVSQDSRHRQARRRDTIATGRKKRTPVRLSRFETCFRNDECRQHRSVQTANSNAAHESRNDPGIRQYGEITQ